MLCEICSYDYVMSILYTLNVVPSNPSSMDWESALYVTSGELIDVTTR